MIAVIRADRHHLVDDEDVVDPAWHSVSPSAPVSARITDIR
jgi:hypothetical protein